MHYATQKGLEMPILLMYLPILVGFTICAGLMRGLLCLPQSI